MIVINILLTKNIEVLFMKMFVTNVCNLLINIVVYVS